MPKTEAVKTPNAPEAIGPYSQAIKTPGTLFLSGQIPIDPETGEITGGDITAQTTQVLENLKAVLKAADLTTANIVKTTVYMTDLREFSQMNETYAQYFTKPYPARATVEVNKLPKDARIEIEAIAVY